MKKSIPKFREQEGNEKKAFPKFRNGKGMKKSIPIIRERESEAFILGNGREREFPLTPVTGRLSNMDPREKDKTLDFDSNACFVMEGKIIKDDHCFVTNHTQKKVQHCRPVPQVLVGCSGQFPVEAESSYGPRQNGHLWFLPLAAYRNRM